MFVCLLVCWFVCFLSATRHLSTLRRCLRVAERAGAVVASGPARAGKGMHSERSRAHTVQLLNEKIAALIRPFPNLLAFLLAKYRNFPEKKFLAKFEQNIDFFVEFLPDPIKIDLFPTV